MTTQEILEELDSLIDDGKSYDEAAFILSEEVGIAQELIEQIYKQDQDA